jgi:hypothetical protein
MDGEEKPEETRGREGKGIGGRDEESRTASRFRAISSTDSILQKK